MLVSAAVCPHPPLLVPPVAAGASGEVAELLEACLKAVRRLLATGTDRLVVVGSATSHGEWGETAGGTLAGYGVPVTAGGPEQVLPLSLTIGAWLLDTAQAADTAETVAAPPDRSYVAVAEDTAPQACAALGGRLASGSERVALLVMGDGSARRSTISPGYVDPRAVDFDTVVATALRRAELDALLALDPELARALWVAGRPAWQVLAGAAQATYRINPDSHITAELTYHAAPYGVGYFVAGWLVARGSDE